MDGLWGGRGELGEEESVAGGGGHPILHQCRVLVKIMYHVMRFE